MFTGFPPILIIVLAPLCGSLVGVLIAVTTSAEPHAPGLLIARFVVGWLTGAFLGPVFSPAVQAMVKAPASAVGFIAGGSGYWFWSKYIVKKQAQYESGELPKPPGDGSNA